MTPSLAAIRVRPQPIGVFPFPAGLLLLPETAEDSNSALESLMRGRLPQELPAAWQFFALAAMGEVAGALEELKGDDPIARHNRIALGSPEARGSDEGILEAAIRYALGRADHAPTAGEFDGELLAFVLMLQATEAIEQTKYQAAARLLERAIDAARGSSAEFAAQLLGQLAALETDETRTVPLCREAVSLAQGPAKAELSLQLGMALQAHAGSNKASMLEAVRAYQDALRFGITIEGNPEGFALLQNNLALAYLGMPMTGVGDPLRMGIAVQSLREALKVYTKEAYPEEWASAQLNLANALQYIPTSHPEENLIQAVEIYDEILAVRQRAFDPVGYARLLANQANALAHLGIFGPAMEKISEAYKLFQWHEEIDMAASAMRLVEEISEQRKAVHGSA